MAFSDSPKFTNRGKQLMAAAAAGEITLNFSKIKMGDGEITTQAAATLTDLINPVVVLDIGGIKSGSNYVTLQADFNNTGLSAGFYWREVGVFVTDPDTNAAVLYCYGNCGTLAEYIAAAGEQSIKKIITVSAIIGDAQNVTAQISDSTYYSPLDLLQTEISAEDLIPFYDTLAGKKNITFALLVEALAKCISIPDLTAHIQDKNNPHAVAKGQIGLGNVENKNSATIRGEITAKNVTDALGYTPPKQDTVYTHPQYTALTGVPTAQQNPAFGGTFQISQVLCDALGHITQLYPRVIKIPNAVVSTSAAGLCPKRGGTTTKYLRDDGTWAVPPKGAEAFTGTVAKGSTVTLGVKPVFVMIYTSNSSGAGGYGWWCAPPGGSGLITITSTGFTLADSTSFGNTSYYIALA